ncbi:ClpXP adapter SpxH family protein [Bacillus carboniphilus]|uniref:ClpXP adapter protein SpxH n=1 Tax=Bacillus carboniphilus TaxID=86663 RepID=A0ABY9JW17_9BACI|nr:ClpXP adapter SpxH family protein [Bacillus carboniphilus]WLR42953.1 ClpXP adapter SpxH family protein [Bacillus carboniphilus]
MTSLRTNDVAQFFSHCHANAKKPLEIYMFIDPICPECWALEPIVKKLKIEYGRFFTLRYIVSGKINTLNRSKKHKPLELAKVWEKTASRTGMSCDGNIWFEHPISSPYSASIAIKAAELQGRKSGLRFLRKLQEVLFLEKQNIDDYFVLLSIAESVGLDLEEFREDLHSNCAAKALQCDMKITSEMEISQIPSLVFFNEVDGESGLKITGMYSYETYVKVLEEMLQTKLKPSQTPPLEAFLKFYQFVATKEIAVVYNMEEVDVEREMKKYLLKQTVEKVPVKHGTFWRYKNPAD